MKQKAWGKALIVLFAVSLLFTSPLFAAGDVKITGTVVEVTKMQTGEVVMVAIRDSKEDILVDSNKGKGAELLKLVNKKVEAMGQVTDIDGSKSIVVNDFKVLE